jgi:hypothetical protein
MKLRWTFPGSPKEYEDFTANIGVKVRGVREVRGKFFEN